MMTKQEVFDKVWSGLKAQGFVRAATSGGLACQYRATGPKGEVLKCAAGQLIPDSEYNPDCDDRAKGGGKEITNTPSSWLGPTLVGIISNPDLRTLVVDLQRAHDGFNSAGRDRYSPAAVEKRLRDIAAWHALNVPGNAPQTSTPAPIEVITPAPAKAKRLVKKLRKAGHKVKVIKAKAKKPAKKSKKAAK